MSNLTVSYVSQTPPGIAPAGATAAAAPAADSPLGFLAALVDQLLAGGAEGAKADIAATTSAAIDGPGLLNLGMTTETEIAAAPQGADLIAALATQLDTLQHKLETGEAVPPAQLVPLRETIDALTAAIDAAPADAEAAVTKSPAISGDQITQLLAALGLTETPPARPADKAALATEVEASDQIAALHDRLLSLSQTLAATAPDLSKKLEALATKLEANPELAVQLGLAGPQPDADAVTIAHIVRTLLGHPTGTAPADSAPELPAASGAPTTNDDLLKILATLGISVPPAGVSAPSADASAGAPVDLAASTTPAVTAIAAPLLRLSSQLSKISTELASAAPDLAKKLEAVATRLMSADADPELLGKLTSAASQPNGTALDKLVQALIDPKAAPETPAPAAPPIAASTELALPAPLAPKQSKSAVTEVKAAPPETAPVTADSAPKPAPGATLAAVAREAAGDATSEPKVEAKVAAIVADATKAEPATQPAQPQPPALNAQQARPLPAAYQTVANPINMGQVAFEMARQVHQGSSRFTIRLDPPEMGRVDVRMQVDASGTVNARLTVDRAETLDLFQRDRQSLERALAQAGLDASKTTLEFSLRQNNHNPFAGMMGGDQHQQQSGYGAPSRSLAGNDDMAPLPAITLYRGTASAGGVNIFA